jgi:xylulokinase
MAGGGVLIGVDLGQTACKAVALHPTGGVVATAESGYPTSQPWPGWAEQEPDDWLRAGAAACREVVARAAAVAAGAEEILGLAITGATHNAVLIDAAGAPVRPCITLRDGRSAAQAERINRQLGAELLRRARNRASAGWTAPQLAWIKEHEPEAWDRARGLLFAKDYVRSKLTGERSTDHIDAEGSLLLNAAARDWDPALCESVPIERSWLPPVRAPAERAGAVSAEGAALTGLRPGTPVFAGCSDTAAEALACGAVGAGQGVVKLATAGNLNVVGARPIPSSAYFCYSHPVEGLVYHSFGTNSAASARAWLQELLGKRDDHGYGQLDREAARVPAGAEGLLFHPYLYGERAPVFDSTLRASFLGITARHGRAHLLRAVLEGVALSLADCARAMTASGLALGELRIIGGGARSALWRQIVADVLGRPLLVPALSDASAGAALLAGVGAGVFRDPADAARQSVAVTATVTPDPIRTAGYAEILELYREARTVLAPLHRQLAEISW